MEKKSSSLESEKLINELESLRQSNPELFIKAIQALGLGPEDDGKFTPSSANNMSINEVTEAIKSMRTGDSNPEALNDLLTKPIPQVSNYSLFIYLYSYDRKMVKRLFQKQDSLLSRIV